MTAAFYSSVCTENEPTGKRTALQIRKVTAKGEKKNLSNGPSVAYGISLFIEGLEKVS